VPTRIYLKNYKYAYAILTYWRHFKNSVLVTAVGTAGHMLSCAFIGYGLARYKLPGGKLIFFIIILTIIIPVQTLIVPSYMIYANLKWINSYLPVLVPTFFGYGLKGPLFIYLFRQFYLGIPKDLENAAKIDGSGHLQTYFRIIMPTAQSAFLVTLVLSIVWHWNDFYEIGVYTSSLDLVTLPGRLKFLVAFVQNPDNPTFHTSPLFEILKSLDKQGVINNAVMMAGNILVMLPVIISFIFLQRKFMQGIERTGLVE
jgi:multiple sugar transport system permease protein